MDFHFRGAISAQQIEAMKRGGGVVLYIFDQPSVVRVAIDVSAVPGVMGGAAKPNYADTVADTTNHSPAATTYYCLDAG
jgi:hypothetical protein